MNGNKWCGADDIWRGLKTLDSNNLYTSKIGLVCLGEGSKTLTLIQELVVVALDFVLEDQDPFRQISRLQSFQKGKLKNLYTFGSSCPLPHGGMNLVNSRQS